MSFAVPEATTAEMPQLERGSVGGQSGLVVAPGRYTDACAASGIPKKPMLASARANERERERERVKAHGFRIYVSP
jgi:hypothetical protein